MQEGSTNASLLNSYLIGFVGNWKGDEMAKYKRAELAEDEDSVHIDHLKTHVIPVQPKGLWESRSQLEKFLLLSCSCMFLSLLIFTALAIHGLKSSYVVQFNPLYKGMQTFIFRCRKLCKGNMIRPFVLFLL